MKIKIKFLREELLLGKFLEKGGEKYERAESKNCKES